MQSEAFLALLLHLFGTATQHAEQIFQKAVYYRCTQSGQAVRLVILLDADTLPWIRDRVQAEAHA